MTDLFGGDDEATERPAPASARRGKDIEVDAIPAPQELVRLAARLPSLLHLGTSSWSFPGWRGLVWRGEHTGTQLSRNGLAAYGRHPLLRCVSLDRSFYRPLTSVEYAAHAAQVPEHFRFIVKAPSLVCDALVRGNDGRGRQDNPAFLDPGLALREFVQPALAGLGSKAGALVFQLSPLPARSIRGLDELLQRLVPMLAAAAGAVAQSPGVVVAVEVRDPEFLTPAFASALRASGATYCLGLHPRMPPIEEQLPMLRAMWPGPLVCRWSLNRRHGVAGYADAKGRYEPFDRMHDPDPETRQALATVIAATLAHQLPVYVSINNKAEGCAPLSVIELAMAVAERAPQLPDC